MVDGPFPSNPYSITPTQDFRDQRSAYYAGQQQQANAGVPEIFRNPFITPTTKKDELGFSTASPTPKRPNIEIPIPPKKYTPTPIPNPVRMPLSTST